MVLPEIIVGVSLSIFFAAVGIPLGLFTVFVAHVTFTMPFVYMMVMARLDEFDYSIVEAAGDLGANDTQTLLRVTLPLCMPGIMSGFLTAVTVSLEDFVVTYFVTGPGATTLPVFINSAIRHGISPVINALSIVMILGTVLLCCLLRNFLKYIAAKKPVTPRQQRKDNSLESGATPTSTTYPPLQRYHPPAPPLPKTTPTYA
jgi:spermidine/putrescine transport system permease protein